MMVHLLCHDRDFRHETKSFRKIFELESLFQPIVFLRPTHVILDKVKYKVMFNYKGKKLCRLKVNLSGTDFDTLFLIRRLRVGRVLLSILRAVNTLYP
jgi:hypothetical protein